MGDGIGVAASGGVDTQVLSGLTPLLNGLEKQH